MVKLSIVNTFSASFTGAEPKSINGHRFSATDLDEQQKMAILNVWSICGKISMTSSFIFPLKIDGQRLKHYSDHCEGDTKE